MNEFIIRPTMYITCIKKFLVTLYVFGEPIHSFCRETPFFISGSKYFLGHQTQSWKEWWVFALCRNDLMSVAKIILNLYQIINQPLIIATSTLLILSQECQTGFLCFLKLNGLTIVNDFINLFYKNQVGSVTKLFYKIQSIVNKSWNI